jgi:hypothetical protein
MWNIILYYANLQLRVPEDEGSRLLQKVDNLLPNYMALHPRGQFLYSLPWPHVLKQILHSPKENVYWKLTPAHIHVFVTPAKSKGNN